MTTYIGPLQYTWPKTFDPDGSVADNYSAWRRSHGDGSCFYWAFLYGLLTRRKNDAVFGPWRERLQYAIDLIQGFRLNHAPTPHEARALLTALDNARSKMDVSQSLYPALVRGLRLIAASELLAEMLLDTAKRLAVFAGDNRAGAKYDTIGAFLSAEVLGQNAFASNTTISCLAKIFKVKVNVVNVLPTRVYSQLVRNETPGAPPSEFRRIHVLRTNQVHYDYLEPPPANLARARLENEIAKIRADTNELQADFDDYITGLAKRIGNRQEMLVDARYLLNLDKLTQLRRANESKIAALQAKLSGLP